MSIDNVFHEADLPLLQYVSTICSMDEYQRDFVR